MKKKLKKFAIISGILFLAALTLFILWTTWENWSGAREWEKTRAMLVSNDVALDASELISELPADHLNFCAAPLIASLMQYERAQTDGDLTSLQDEPQVSYQAPAQRKRLLRLKAPHLKPGSGYPQWSNATSVNLNAVRDAIAKEDESKPPILEWIAQFQSELDELDTAAQRPEAVMPFPYSDDFVANISMPSPPLSEFRELTKFQMIRACAALEAGDNKQAISALQGIHKIQQASASHPTLIGYLVSQSTLDSFLSVVWQGMKDDRWSVEDLRRIQAFLTEASLLPALERGLNFEMVTLQIGAADYLKDISVRDSLELARVIEPLNSGKPAESSPLGLVALVVPSGIWDHNKAFGCRLLYEQGILPVRERRRPDSEAFMEQMQSRGHRNFLAGITVPAVNRVIERAYHAETALELARVACAIELNRAETGEYCESLNELVPIYLPEIPMDIAAPSKLLQYKKELSGGRYRIYSVGQNLTDEGGVPGFRKNGRRAFETGDWAWGYEFGKAKIADD